jgi:outer membrane lipoprotein LolB
VSARTAGLALVVALFAACATVTIQPRDPRPFDLLGRVSVTYTAGTITANTRWEHAADRDEIWLMTPTGQTMAHILERGAGVVLTRADGEQHRASDVETLTRQVLGWPLPLSQLQYWVRGLPVPGAAPAEAEYDGAKRLTAFTQNGWRVALTYHEGGDYAGKVRRVDLIDGPNRIRFLVDTWRET